MQKYYPLALFLLFVMALFLTINTFNEDITGYAIGDNETIIDDNGTIVKVDIFFPSDQYNTTEQNLTFRLNLYNVGIVYSSLNGGTWDIDLAEGNYMLITLSLEEGSNLASFYGCSGDYCSTTRSVNVNYTNENLEMPEIIESNITSNESVVLEQVTQEPEQVVQEPVQAEETIISDEVETPKKSNLTLIIGVGIVALLAIYITVENIREKVLDKKNEVKS